MAHERNLAVIPARSGSKGLKDKNIKELRGKPLMAYAIEAALKSEVFDEVMVSTESEAYADIARRCGAEVPFLRSDATAADASSGNDVIREVLAEYRKCGKAFDAFCVLQPTSPLRIPEDIREAYRIFCEKDAIAVVSVCEVEHSPLWCGVLEEDCSMDGFLKPQNVSPRQSLETYYRLNGAIYFTDVSAFEENDFLYREGSYAYVMPQERSVDIDSELDFRLAELLVEGVWRNRA